MKQKWTKFDGTGSYLFRGSKRDSSYQQNSPYWELVLSIQKLSNWSTSFPEKWTRKILAEKTNSYFQNSHTPTFELAFQSNLKISPSSNLQSSPLIFSTLKPSNSYQKRIKIMGLGWVGGILGLGWWV